MFERYKFYRNKVNMLISTSKRNYLRIFFQEVEEKKKKNGQINTKSLVANKFNNYFVNVSQNLLKSLEKQIANFKIT